MDVAAVELALRLLPAFQNRLRRTPSIGVEVGTAVDGGTDAVVVPVDDESGVAFVVVAVDVADVPVPPMLGSKSSVVVAVPRSVSVEVAVVLVAAVDVTGVVEAMGESVAGIVEVETALTGTGAGTKGVVDVAISSVEVAAVDVAVESVMLVVGVVVAFVAVSGTMDTGVGPPMRFWLNQYATAATPSDHEAYVVIDVPVLPTFPGLKVCEPVPAVPNCESNSMIAIVRRVSTPY